MEALTMVIKVKYQETLRRFHVLVTDDEIDLDVDRLWEKLHTLFNLTPNNELMLTYTDEDGDEVALVDDDDLRDVAKQALDPLRITVKLSYEKIGIQYCPSGSCTLLKARPPLRNGSKTLKHVPEHVNETIEPMTAESKAMRDKFGEGEKAMDQGVEKIRECHAKDNPLLRTFLPSVANTEWCLGKIGGERNFPAEKATNVRGPNVEPYRFDLSASDPIKVDHVGGRTKSILPGSFGNSTGSIWAPYPGMLGFPEFCSSPNLGDVSPISRIPVENVSAFRSHPASKAVTSSGCNSQNVDTFHVFHCGVFCDGCGVHPITGPRFMSKVKNDYDLCMICFAEMGNASDYIRIDHPVVYAHHVLYDSAEDMDSVSLQDCRGLEVKSCLSEMDCCFVKDVNIIDDTVMAPLTPFTKMWRLKNNGFVVWPKKTTIFWMGGDKLGSELSVELKIPAAGLAINQELDVAVDCIAPELPGKYESGWGLASPSGQWFGQLNWIRIEVVASAAAKPHENVMSFNLNLPPLSSYLNDPKTIDAFPESIVKYCQNDPEINYNTSVTSSSVPSPTTPVSHPIFDHLNIIAPAFPSISSDVLPHIVPLPDVNLPASEDEGMSFKSADCNEDLSIMSADSLDLDDDSESSEWDPVLDELLDMGFYDIELNKWLLEKTNGCIRHVVMELIAEESK